MVYLRNIQRSHTNAKGYDIQVIIYAITGDAPNDNAIYIVGKTAK